MLRLVFNVTPIPEDDKDLQDAGRGKSTSARTSGKDS